MSHTVTQDFREEYEAERTRWLRRRFLWYAGVLGAFNALNLGGSLLSMAFGGATGIDGKALLFISLNGFPQVVLFTVSFLYVLRRSLPQGQLLRLVFWLTVLSGAISVVTAPFFARFGAENGAAVTGENIIWYQRTAALTTVFVTHFVACLFIPWTPREAVRPVIPLLAIVAIYTMLFGGGVLLGRLGFIAISPAVGVPGVLVCWWRHSRFRTSFHYRMLRGRYGELQRELLDARSVHEELFPPPILEGPVFFHYRYEPMREIGGDYLYVQRSATGGALNVVLLDITGHGIKAALTVNRVFGELERIFAESPDIAPGDLMLALNRYVRLTLAKHNIYATALCLRIDPSADEMAYCNGGHPPAFLRTAGGLIDRLDSTAPLLGVFPRESYDPGELRLRFGVGDTLIAYTDGVTDTANDNGERLQIEGIQRILHADKPETLRKGRWAGTIAREINRYRFGPVVDDTLLVEIWRPLESEQAASKTRTFRMRASTGA